MLRLEAIRPGRGGFALAAIVFIALPVWFAGLFAVGLTDRSAGRGVLCILLGLPLLVLGLAFAAQRESFGFVGAPFSNSRFMGVAFGIVAGVLGFWLSVYGLSQLLGE